MGFQTQQIQDSSHPPPTGVYKPLHLSPEHWPCKPPRSLGSCFLPCCLAESRMSLCALGFPTGRDAREQIEDLSLPPMQARGHCQSVSWLVLQSSGVCSHCLCLSNPPFSSHPLLACEATNSLRFPTLCSSCLCLALPLAPCVQSPHRAFSEKRVLLS